MDEIKGTELRPIHIENTDPRPVQDLWKPEYIHENVLDALHDACGVQWGIKRPIAQAIVDYYMKQNPATPAMEKPNEPTA